MESKNERSQENIVSSFFFYMWNRWCKEECEIVYGIDSVHFWEKWCRCCKESAHGATECFYATLSDDTRRKLVTRACETYNGRQEIISNSK